MSWMNIGVAAVSVVGSLAGGSKQKSSQTNEYSNPTLGGYAQGYMGAAPWGFASLDPTATIGALDASGNETVGGKSLGGAFRQNLNELSAAEKQERTDTDAALSRIRKRQESGQFLTPQETDFINTSLDKAFAYAHKTGMEDWTKATQMMAGSRGMRMSDTPVADPAMRELRNFQLGLGSERAKLGMETTLGFAAQQQNFDASFSQFYKTLQQNRAATRQGFLFGGGMQGAGNIAFRGMGNSMQTNMPSMMDNLGQAGSIVGNAMMAYKGAAGPGGSSGGFGGFGGGSSNYGGMPGMTPGALGGPMFGK